MGSIRYLDNGKINSHGDSHVSGEERIMPTLPWIAAKGPPPQDTAELVVMASRLRLRSLWDVPAFLWAAMRIRRQMLNSPGALGVSLIAKPAKRAFWTLSAWQDQASLSATVGRQPHRDVMKRFSPKLADSRFITWTTPASALPPSWPEALRRLDRSASEPDKKGKDA
jgi:hypothetical protein